MSDSDSKSASKPRTPECVHHTGTGFFFAAGALVDLSMQAHERMLHYLEEKAKEHKEQEKGETAFAMRPSPETPTLRVPVQQQLLMAVHLPRPQLPPAHLPIRRLSGFAVSNG